MARFNSQWSLVGVIIKDLNFVGSWFLLVNKLLNHHSYEIHSWTISPIESKCKLDNCQIWENKMAKMVGFIEKNHLPKCYLKKRDCSLTFLPSKLSYSKIHYTIQRPNGERRLHRYARTIRRPNGELRRAVVRTSAQPRRRRALGAKPMAWRNWLRGNFCACAALHISLHTTEDNKFIFLGFLFIYFWRFLSHSSVDHAIPEFYHVEFEDDCAKRVIHWGRTSYDDTPDLVIIAARRKLMSWGTQFPVEDEREREISASSEDFQALDQMRHYCTYWISLVGSNKDCRIDPILIRSSPSSILFGTQRVFL
jgi:hypothetical protein